VNNNMKQSRPALRFRIMCRGTTLHAWQARCLEKLLDLDDVKPALLIIDKPDTSTYAKRKTFDLFRLFRYIYYLFSAKFRARATRPLDMSSVLSGVPSVYCRVIRKGKYSQYFSEDDIDLIRKHNLDFILRFGFGIIRGEILNTARFGVWSFHHGDEMKYRGGPFGFWEIYKGDSVTGAILQRLTDRLDGGVVLKKGFIKTINTSYFQNQSAILFESVEWPAQVCIDIKIGNAKYLDLPPSKTTAPIYRAPNILQKIIFFLKIVGNNILDRYNYYFFYDQWNVGIVNSPIDVFLKPTSLPQVKWLPAPSRNEFIADPFAVCLDKVVHILVEDFNYRTFKGGISAISIQGNSISRSKDLFNLPFHMSYPYLIKHQGQIYCIPETSEAQEVSIYKAEKFPNKWTKVATLIKDFAGVDSTIFCYNNHWWLLVTDANEGLNYRLKIWHAPDLFGPWQPHPANPVKVDVRSSRPAGTPFIYKGELYRPSQDCSSRYGGRIILNRVSRLTPVEFREESVAVIGPYQNCLYRAGLHTISSVGDVTIIDGVRKVSVFKNPVMLTHNMKIFRLHFSAIVRRIIFLLKARWGIVND